MEDNKQDQRHTTQSSRGGELSGRDNSIGNRQGTAQTGGQNAGGENIDQEEDQYTDDLHQSGNRSSRKEKE